MPSKRRFGKKTPAPKPKNTRKRVLVGWKKGTRKTVNGETTQVYAMKTKNGESLTLSQARKALESHIRKIKGTYRTFGVRIMNPAGEWRDYRSLNPDDLFNFTYVLTSGAVNEHAVARIGVIEQMQVHAVLKK